MRHIYNGGGDTADFTDKDQLWSSGGDQDQESGSRPPRWVMVSTLPHTMCVDPQTFCLACQHCLLVLAVASSQEMIEWKCNNPDCIISSQYKLPISPLPCNGHWKSLLRTHVIKYPPVFRIFVAATSSAIMLSPLYVLLLSPGSHTNSYPAD